ncbi:DUF2933 domain-containing protein [Allosphingosinicella flava]|uniref:DUF2933 domain-containing protein n=2 Tax=Allosphingosinicella flava TaxID=2771430 RepID=A0A7T2LM28_9SPHN|nr:DUF2933 domain-containing protein [Sphingosinicella flava]
MKITINVLWLVIPAAVGLVLLLFSSHRQHVLDFLPFLILLSCPLMHLFMPHRHSRSSRDNASARPSKPARLTLTSCQGSQGAA